MAYKQTYGNCFLRHRFPKDSSRPRHKQSPGSSERQTPKKTRVKIPKLRARIPVSSPDNSSDDDSYRAALTVASERRRNRPNIFEKRDDYWNNSSVTPDSGNTSRRNRTGENVRSTVKGLLRKNDSVLVGFSLNSCRVFLLLFFLHSFEATLLGKNFLFLSEGFQRGKQMFPWDFSKFNLSKNRQRTTIFQENWGNCVESSKETNPIAIEGRSLKFCW